MKIFYTKRPDYKILLYFLCINTLQEIRLLEQSAAAPDRLEQQSGGRGSIYI